MQSRGFGASGAKPLFRDRRTIGFDAFVLDRAVKSALIHDFNGSDWLFTALANG
jgi:hypothetical protein